MTKKNIAATLRRIGAVGLAAATVAAGLSLGPAAHAAAAAPDASGPASLIGKLITINYGGAEGTRDKYWSPQAPQIGKWVTGPTTSYISDARAAAVEWQIPAVGSTGPIRGTGSASGVCIVGLASPGNIMAAACNGSPFQDFSWFDVSNTYGTGLGLSPVVAGASYLSFGTIIGNGIFQTMSGADSVVLDEFEAVFRAAVTSIDVARRTATVGGSAAPHATIRVDGTQQVSADGAGVWSATVSGLSLGMNQVALEHWENGVRTADATVDVDLAVQPVTASATFPDDPTRDAVLAGTAHPGATVVVQDAAGAELDRAPVGTDGAWTADIPAPNAGGDYPVTVHQEIDGEANGEITETIAYGAAVTVTRPVPDEAHDGGPVSLRGTGEAGARIDVREEGRTTVIGTETVLVDGTWNLTTTDVDDREHTLVATQTGKGRNVTTQTITLNPDADGVAQPFALTDPKDGDTVVAPDNQVTFTGVGTTGDTVVITNTFNGRVVATTTIDDAGTWSRTGSVGFGVQDLRATVTHGGVATGHPLTITVNATAGVVGPFAISTPADGSTVVAPDNRVTFTGTGTTGARVVLTAGTGRQVVNTVVDGHGNWSATGYLSHQWYELDTTYTVPGSAPVTGKTTVTVVETDAVIAPFGITSPADGSTVVAPTNMVTFTGTGAAGATVELINDLGGPWERVVARATVQNDGTWTATGGLGFQTYPLAYVHTPGDLGGTPATGTTIVTVVAR